MTTEAPDRLDTPKQEYKRVYIFHPEEPFLLLWRGGRMLRFNNGRLVSTTIQEDGRPLSEDDLEWFRREADESERQTGIPKYVIWEGEINDAARGILMLHLADRVTRQILTRAHGADATTLSGDIRMAVQMLLASDDGLPDVRTHRPNGVLETVGRVAPSLAETMRAQAEFAQMQVGNIAFDGLTTRERLVQQLRDDEVIANAAAGIQPGSDELKPPATKNVDETSGGSGSASGSGASNTWG